MEDKAGGPVQKDVPQERAFQAIEGLTGFRPMLIPQQLPWQLGVQFGISWSNWH